MQHLRKQLVIISHKICSPVASSPTGFGTDGGFPVQIGSISELFSETRIVVPCENTSDCDGLSPLTGRNLQVAPLSAPKGTGFKRKLYFPFWLLKNAKVIWDEIKKADAVHTPIPGDIGTVGMLIALVQRKPLFVRHCGNWLVQRTVAERFWKWSIEHFAGGRNVMLATGGADTRPSEKNPNIDWIFATSLSREDLNKARPRPYPKTGKLRLITACRLEERKGVDVVIESIPKILETYPEAELDVVGDGSMRLDLERRVESLGLAGIVRFHGKVKQPRVTDLMRAAHVFCFPTSASEGFPKVVIEALSCGLPVVTTRVSVLPKLVGCDVGRLIDAPTAEFVASAVSNILADVETYERMSVSAMAAAGEYSLERWREIIGVHLHRAWNNNSVRLPRDGAEYL